MASDRYWIEMIAGFVIVAIVVVLFVYVYKPAPKPAEGFSEEYCISLLAGHSKDAGSVQLTPIREGSMLFKDGVAGEENETIRVFLQANRYEGILEYCRLSSFSTKSVLAEDPKDIRLQCKFGELRMRYGLTDRYNYIHQEILLSGEKRAAFLGEITNFSALEKLTEATLGEQLGSGDYYQASITYVNPALRDVYSTHIDAFLDTTKLMNCSGTLPSDLIELSKYKISMGVSSLGR